MPGPATTPENAASAAVAVQAAVAEEQAYVDTVYERLDALRAAYGSRLADVRRQGPSGSPQNRSERDAFAAHYADAVARLDQVENRLVFGRLDLRRDEPRYVGRVGLSDAEHNQLLVDWRAPSARPFYQATAAHPGGVVRRRHLMTRARAVIGVEDELLDHEHLDEAVADGLTGEGALFAAMSAAREGRMHDIVATIQAEQDAVIRSPLDGVLVVQGGPGTGKTAVALHRAAFLLYAHRQRLERSGVLLVGPSRVFLRYIEQVLPSLGESDVVATTMADLLPGTTATGEEGEEVAAVKGRAAMAQVLARAVRGLQRVPDAEQELVVEGTRLHLNPDQVRSAMARARRTGLPHNQARDTFVLAMLDHLVREYAGTRGMEDDPAERAYLREDVRTARDVRVALNLCWMPTTPHGLLERLFARPDLLERHAGGMSARDRALLRREKGSPWTEADIALLDELAELLGPHEQAQAGRAQAEAKIQAAEEVRFAQEAISSQGLGMGMVTAEMLAERFTATGPRLTTAERAATDRTWTYGHIVVDEAQELSAMAWRALLRRCPARSMTVVGDLAQRSGHHPVASWSQVLGRAAGEHLRESVLTVSYRTPATVMDAATAVLAGLGVAPAYPVRAARDLPDALAVTRADGGAPAAAVVEAARAELARLDASDGPGAGRVAVIVPARRRGEVLGALARADGVRDALAPAGTDPLEARLAVLSTHDAKGLEFDVVVLVEPAEVLEGGTGDIYVAMTRPTRRLHVVHARDLPEGFPVG
ncbi:AAA family ATPase [Georgenia yuyongxinii]|uniref:AAA family ATPase n=1 Tax=Georgenia yuyongxinii TaxID=2589797 RepID=A0A5B8C4B1_9MICO|nr:AAA family ATPase [Georgenia yuyongxinii]QDC24321.1 AAA family ATPase [Georgenia yuyongxinii]